MRYLSGLILLSLVGCNSGPAAHAPAPGDPALTGGKRRTPASEHLTADTPKTTALGNTFMAPAGWSISVAGPATILEPPEGDSHIALFDVKARDGDAALAAAWTAYKPDTKWPLKVAQTDAPDRDGWSKGNELRVPDVAEREARRAGRRRCSRTALARRRSSTVAKRSARSAAVRSALIFSHLYPKGYARESFAGKKAQQLDAARIAALTKFVERRRGGDRRARRVVRHRSRTARSSSPAASACASSARRSRSTATRCT